MAFRRCSRSSTFCYGALTFPKIVQALTAPLAMQISPQGVGGQVRKSLSGMAGVSMFVRDGPAIYLYFTFLYILYLLLAVHVATTCTFRLLQCILTAKLRMQWQ